MHRHVTRKTLPVQHKNKKTPPRGYLVPLSLAIGTALLLIAASMLPSVQIYELKAYDWLFRWITKEPAHPDIVHIDIDDRSVEQIGKWPWSRDKHARLIQTLNECGARSIAFDILFIEPGKELPRNERLKEALIHALEETFSESAPAETVPVTTEAQINLFRFRLEEEIIDEDALFSGAIRQSKAGIYLPFYFPSETRPVPAVERNSRTQPADEPSGFISKVRLDTQFDLEATIPSSPNLFAPSDRIAGAVTHSGFVNIIPELDGTVRRTHLLWKAKGVFLPQMFFKLALDEMGFQHPALSMNRSILGPELKIEERNSGKSLGIPVSKESELFIHWAGRWGETFRHVPYAAVLQLDQIREDVDRLAELLDQPGKYGRGELARLRTEMLEESLGNGAPEKISTLKNRRNTRKQELTDFLRRRISEATEQFGTETFPGVLQEMRHHLETLEAGLQRQKMLEESLTRLLENKICIVGLTATGAHDMKPIPLEPSYPMVGMNSNLIHTVLTKSFIRKAPAWLDALLILLCAFIVYFITLSTSNWKGAFYTSLFMLTYVACAFIALDRAGLWLYVWTPLAASALSYAAITAFRYSQQEHEKRWIRNAFQSYLSENVVREILNHPDKLKLGGEMKNMTLLFCDIRGFTTTAEQFGPEELTRFINRFLTPMTEIIMNHGGTVDKYMGDCIMAFWNAPLDDPKHAEHAFEAALKMRERLKELNQMWQAEAESQKKNSRLIQIGIGINTGNCCVGNMGADQRFDYSVLGDDVNLASRLEGQSKTYGVDIVVGQNSQEQASAFALLELDLIKVRGKTRPAHIFALLGNAGYKATPVFQALESNWMQMLEAYRNQNWQEAEKALRICRGIDGGLTDLFNLYEERLKNFKVNNPGIHWDGAAVALTK